MIRLLLLLLCCSMPILAKSSTPSPIPLPKSYILNLSEDLCDDWCLEDLAAQEQPFSFLALSPKQLPDMALNEQRAIYSLMLNIDQPLRVGMQIELAMLIPKKKIGRYAYSTVNSTKAYLLSRNSDFNLRIFTIDDESLESVGTALEQIESLGIGYVIAPMTLEGANSVVQQNSSLRIFFPTIHKDDINQSSPLLYFGGINYQDQIALLVEHVQSPLVIFYDNSEFGKRLMEQTKQSYIQRLEQENPFEAADKARKIYSYKIDQDRSNLKLFLKDNKKIVEGSFILHTPLIKSSMIMSQLTLYERNATNILSTQINYSPMIFEMTQPRDRREMLIASSLSYQPEKLAQRLLLLDSETMYDRINYATVVGTDYFYSLLSAKPREYNIPISNQQVQYQPTLLKVLSSSFEQAY